MKNVAFDLSLLSQQRLAVELPEREAAAVELEEEEHILAEKVEERIAVAVELAAVFELSFDYSPLRSKQREWDRGWHADLTVDGSSPIFSLFGTSWQDKITVFTKNTEKSGERGRGTVSFGTRESENSIFSQETTCGRPTVSFE